MHIRRYKASDLAQCNDIIVDTTKNDTLTHFLSKDAERYPTSYWRNSMLYVRPLFAEKGAQCFVMVADSSDSHSYIDQKVEHIIALAVFTRRGTSAVAKEWQNSTTNNTLLHIFERQSTSWTKRYHQFLPYTMPTSAEANRAKIRPLLETDFDSYDDIFSEAWEVCACFTHRNWQRRGIARQMLEWVKVAATAEGVPVVVKSSPIGVRAYRRHGFRGIRVEGFYRFFDELRFGGEKHQEMVWEPQGREGEWYNAARAKALHENEADVNAVS